MRRFYLLRKEDPTGVSGEGVVVEGVLFPNGTAVIRWLSHISSVSIYHGDGERTGIDEICEVHGHNGCTEVVWVDPEIEGKELKCDKAKQTPKNTSRRLRRDSLRV